jgi:hypothetical protein
MIVLRDVTYTTPNISIRMVDCVLSLPWWRAWSRSSSLLNLTSRGIEYYIVNNSGERERESARARETERDRERQRVYTHTHTHTHTHHTYICIGEDGMGGLVRTYHVCIYMLRPN